MESFTSTVQVERIANLQDPVSRNDHITQSYHQLSQALSQRLGPCANWCSFATWASRQAGQTIRREDLRAALEEHLNTTPDINTALEGIANIALAKGSQLTHNAISKLLWEIVNPYSAMERASAAVARGNQKVYAEIGLEFARFQETCLNDVQKQRENLARFCAQMRPGDPPEGQRYLQQAFSRYYQAFFESNTKAKAELILLANLEIGFHEQTRLQPEIAAALEASVEDPDVLKRQIISALFPSANWMNSLGSFFRAITGRPSPLEALVAHFTTIARHHIRLFLTHHMMALGFPKKVRLRLGQDLKAQFPVMLIQLKNEDLLALLGQIDPTPGSLAETGAIDWADLPDRLHFIADLFRCYQETPDLLMPPFDVWPPEKR